MIRKLSILVLLICTIVTLHEYRYWNKVSFIPPVAYTGEVPIREDAYGDGQFGAKRSGRRKHKGIDILARFGEPVLAVRSGRVLVATERGGYGKHVIISHGKGYKSLYAHLSKISVEQGDRVKQGGIIGEIGKSGNAKNALIHPHLHFEWLKDDEPENPLDYLG